MLRLYIHELIDLDYFEPIFILRRNGHLLQSNSAHLFGLHHVTFGLSFEPTIDRLALLSAGADCSTRRRARRFL